ARHVVGDLGLEGAPYLVLGPLDASGGERGSQGPHRLGERDQRAEGVDRDGGRLHTAHRVAPMRHFTPEEANAALADVIDELAERGVQVKDVDEGLVDFPALRRGETVLLCWRLGEDEVSYWHTLEAGFAGRRPLPLD